MNNKRDCPSIQLDWYQLDILITFLVENKKDFLKHINGFGHDPSSYYSAIHERLEAQFVARLGPG